MKYSFATFCSKLKPSRPARGAWIEMGQCVEVYPHGKVAPRKGRVD